MSIVCGRTCEQWCKVTWIGIIVFCNRKEGMPSLDAILSYFQTDYTIVWLYHVWYVQLYKHVFAEFWHRLHWLKTLGLMLSNNHDNVDCFLIDVSSMFNRPNVQCAQNGVFIVRCACVIHKWAITARIIYALEKTIYRLWKTIYGFDLVSSE